MVRLLQLLLHLMDGPLSVQGPVPISASMAKPIASDVPQDAPNHQWPRRGSWPPDLVSNVPSHASLFVLVLAAVSYAPEVANPT